jgi:YggT family protein
VIGILRLLLTLYWVILLIRILGSWIRIPPSGPVATIFRVAYDLTEPVLRPLRNILPPIRMGMMALDLSPIIVFIVIGILQSYLR